MKIVRVLGVTAVIVLSMLVLWRACGGTKRQATVPGDLPSAAGSLVVTGARSDPPSAVDRARRDTAPVIAPPEQLVYSRKEAKRYLDGLVSQIQSTGTPVPDLDFRPEDNASLEERAQIVASRQSAVDRGKLLIVARSTDGTLHTSESGGEFPRELVPEHIRASLTEDDWEVFQVSMQIATLLKRGFGRSNTSQAKTPNKAPEPTPTAVPR